MSCLRRWARRHREKHAERLRCADLAQEGEVLEKNPLAWCAQPPCFLAPSATSDATVFCFLKPCSPALARQRALPCADFDEH